MTGNQYTITAAKAKPQISISRFGFPKPRSSLFVKVKQQTAESLYFFQPSKAKQGRNGKTLSQFPRHGDSRVIPFFSAPKPGLLQQRAGYFFLPRGKVVWTEATPTLWRFPASLVCQLQNAAQGRKNAAGPQR
jgi:hypothetical protein